jgi:hypothetical protein
MHPADEAGEMNMGNKCDTYRDWTWERNATKQTDYRNTVNQNKDYIEGIRKQRLKN